jgi:hypothetical protein
MLVGLAARWCPADVAIHELQRHNNEFAGREITRTFRIESSEPTAGRFVWNLSANERLLGRGEQEVRIADGTSNVNVKFRLDALRDEVVLPVTLSVAMIVDKQEVAHKTIRLLFFPVDPFQGRSEWLHSLEIRLFDPIGKTEKVFSHAAIPFKATKNLVQIRGMKSGTLVIGSQISLRDYRGLAKATLAAAAQGTRVLWMPPAEGSFPWQMLESASELDFADARIIQRLDKRFDSISWSGEKKLLESQLKLHLSGQRITADVGDEGWPWMEARWYATKGRFVFCGFLIVDCWDDSPTPRHVLLRLLERLNAEELSP